MLAARKRSFRRRANAANHDDAFDVSLIVSRKASVITGVRRALPLARPELEGIANQEPTSNEVFHSIVQNAV